MKLNEKRPFIVLRLAILSELYASLDTFSNNEINDIK